MRYSLRLQTFANVVDDVAQSALPVVFTGTKPECEAYANTAGFVWKDSKSHLFGGYWYKKPEGEFQGECLIPDTGVETTKLKAGDVVEVHGYVMFAKLEPGRYRIKAVGTASGVTFYDFAKPKGTKTVVRHAAASIDYCLSNAENPDLNKIVKVA